MLQDIIQVKALKGYRLRLRFEDGVEGEVDVSELVTFTGIFARLRDLAYFRQVQVNPDLGTVCWPNDADLDPDVLYAIITGQPLTELDEIRTADQVRAKVENPVGEKLKIP